MLSVKLIIKFEAKQHYNQKSPHFNCCTSLQSVVCTKYPTRCQEKDFNNDWKFTLGDNPSYRNSNVDDSKWRSLTLPHDWSIEGEFDKKNPSEASGAFLPGGIGWYRKTFTLPAEYKSKKIFIQFDGIYMNSEIWVNDFIVATYFCRV